MTWRRWLNHALKRTHGLFGEAIEYTILNQEDKIAYIQVGFQDKDVFSTATSTYISNSELLGAPAVVRIEQETPDLKKLEVTEDDLIWYKRVTEEEGENATISKT